MHLIDAEDLTRRFSESDPRMPLLVFALLSFYYDGGAFPFDAGAISRRLADIPLKAKMNPEEVASLEPELRKFFTFGAQGLAPKPGVLTGA